MPSKLSDNISLIVLVVFFNFKRKEKVMNIYFTLLLLAMVLTFSNLQAAIVINPSGHKGMNFVDSLRADSLIVRLDKIGTINQSNLTAAQKSILRKEVQTIKKNLKIIHGGIYLSVGTIIIILLLLIILF